MSALDSRAHKAFHWQRQKILQVQQALNSDPVDIEALRKHAVSHGGLMRAHVRKKAWPKLVGVNVYNIEPYKGAPLSSHKDRAQVLLDVNRCTRRIPKGYSDSQRKAVQEQLTRVILRLLVEHPNLHYYQGLHDIVITFLLVMGEESAYAIMSVLVKYHIRDFLDPDLNRTKMIIAYIPPLLALENAELEEFITSSECAYYFSLSWLITWYGHVVTTPEEAYRLTDVFLATHPLMSVYVAAAIILTQSSEVLSLECEMSAVHGLLSRIPDTLSHEQMIVLACKLFEKHPPSTLAKKARLKLNANSLISTYPKFQRLTRHQRPNHILAHLPKQSTTWWQTSLTLGFVVRLLSVAGPVLLAVAVYWYLQRYIRTSTSAISNR